MIVRNVCKRFYPSQNCDYVISFIKNIDVKWQFYIKIKRNCYAKI